MTNNNCGTCTACCKVFAIAELQKKPGEWCKHCHIGVGCTVYEIRPDACQEFECLYLMSQSRAHPMSESLRPDRCKIVFSPSTNEGVLSGMTMPGAPLAWQKPEVRSLIAKLVKANFRIVVGSPTATTRLMFDRNGQHEIKMTPPDRDGMMWSISEEQQ
jgi:hypothetical protein